MAPGVGDAVNLGARLARLEVRHRVEVAALGGCHCAVRSVDYRVTCGALYPDADDREAALAELASARCGTCHRLAYAGGLSVVATEWQTGRLPYVANTRTEEVP